MIYLTDKYNIRKANKMLKDKKTLKWLLCGSSGQLRYIFLLILARCSMTVLSVIFALTSRSVIDSAVAHDFHALLTSSVKLLAIIASQIFIRLIGQSIEMRVTARLNINFKTNTFRAILSKDYSRISAYHSGDLMTRLNNDISIVSTGIISLIPSVTGLLAGLVYALYTLIRLDRNFAFIFLFGGIILLIVISLFRGVMKNMHKRVQETESNVRSFFQESLASILMVKVFGIENIISDKAVSLQDENYKAQMKRKNLSVFASSSLGFVFSIGSLYALVWSAYRLYTGEITFGTLTAILQLVNQIQSPFAGLSGVVPQYYAILASAERIIEIEDLPAEDSSVKPLDPLRAYKNLDSIHFEGISFNYDRDIILNDADLTVNKGDFLVIAGISGIGKSTLIKLLLGVITPKSGRIYIKNIDGSEQNIGKHSRPLFSYVPQGNLLLSGTIRDAVSLIRPHTTDDEIMRAAEVSCAAEFIKKLPDGLDTHIGEKGLGLSEGQIQRLAVTRAILSDAPIILLDEATSALDEATEEKLLKNIRAMKDKTCIIISHKCAAFEICNKKIFIENKKIVTKE